MHRVAVLALDGVIPFELSIPSRIFCSATTDDGAPLYEVVTCTVDGGPVRTAADFSISVANDASVLATADTVVIPSPTWTGSLSPEAATALASVRPGTRMVSICLGAYVLAAAGLLNDRPATTHWMHSEEFQARFPRVRVNEDVLFVDDGDVLTSAGAAAGVDLCLHLVRRDHGSAVANVVARRCVVPPWRDGGQAQYVSRPVQEPATATTASAREWALTRLSAVVGLDEWAARAGMSRRTFTRRFRDEVGLSPGQWLTRQRVELARDLLETTELPVDAVAEQAGFGTAAAMRHHLRTAVGTSPLSYRRTFHAS
ncbi:GlxA family transcriptional regulator [Actinophytocola algeriensis]|uniref:Transcriptional regulator GlxA family with amidase domain n=1 Tax=Actinophytocola algeriensis TaxID=1768010 RepID=A0A7W7QB26_9PSEU|nr:helix-turn-helix domain-containing protein [Actinophytocola algeriensis]MBB4910299.1 transcriptional regulator GlxA family with amidase domain [Actinophytocola algeriensis]MBE1480712.1 transcriptional regulator GlxA family with amidase domain [Actinophytocola algeriensis]